MTFGRLSSSDYAELLEEPGWAPTTRRGFEIERDKALFWEKKRAEVTEETRRYKLVTEWQTRTLRELYALYGLQFDLQASRERDRWAGWRAAAENRLKQTEKGMRMRLSRARSESATGCAMQTQWLRDHAEIIEALEGQMRR